MFPRGNAANTNRSVALFTLELTLFGGVSGTLKSRQELLDLDGVVNFRFIREMFFDAVSTQMYMTNITMQRGHGIPTQGTRQNVLGALSGVHGQGWGV